MSHFSKVFCPLLVLLLSMPVLSDDVQDKKTDDAEDVKLDLSEGDWKAVTKFVAEQKNKVVVVDIWSTACLPCMKEFPNLVKLQKQYGKKIVCVSLNVDYAGIKSKPPEYYRPRVEKFLRSRNATTFRHFLCSVDGIELFDELGLNSIPAVLVYGKDGKLAKRFDDRMVTSGDEEPFTYQEDINPFIAKMFE